MSIQLQTDIWTGIGANYSVGAVGARMDSDQTPTAPERVSTAMKTSRDDGRHFADTTRKGADELRRLARITDFAHAKVTDFDRVRNKLQVAMDPLGKFKAAAEVDE